MDIPRPEYPRPQARRDRWMNLNGSWDFFEEPERGERPPERFPDAFPDTIRVPFCRESALSGLGRETHCGPVWYRRGVAIPADWEGDRILLHFGAADYRTRVWVDETPVDPPHRGGHTSFTLELTGRLRAGEEHVLTICCEDGREESRPRGKQRVLDRNTGCHYVQTTGIWQTVWLEPVPPAYLDRPRITPSVDRGEFVLEQRVRHPGDAHSVRATLSMEGRRVASDECPLSADAVAALRLRPGPDDLRLWEPGNPFLYDLDISLRDAEGVEIDRIASYAGLRSVAVRGHEVRINGKPVFQRLVLDQGYYPDGLLTAPSDAALLRDLELGLEHGFNGARFHQKVFEERSLYHADRLGYLVWGEQADWGPEFQDRERPAEIHGAWIEEWMEALERDYSHPCVVGWCPLNEQAVRSDAHRARLESVQRALVLATRAADRSRPVLDTSGWSHMCPETDVYDDHSYEQDPEKLAAGYADLDGFDRTSQGAVANTVTADGKPFFVSEMAGMKWAGGAADDEAWGYGDAPESETAWLERLRRMCAGLAANPRVFGYCVTQLTDVFQEQNGVLRFDRTPKFDPAAVRAAQSDPPAIES